MLTKMLKALLRNCFHQSSLLKVPFVWYHQQSDSFLNVRTCTWDVSEETVHAMSHWYRINANADNDQPDNVVRVCNTCRSTLMSCAAYSCTQTLPQEQRERGMYTSVADINSKISPS